MLVDLTEFRLIFGNGHTSAVENDKTSTGSTLINSTNKAFLEIIRPSIFILQYGTISIVGLRRADGEIGFVIIDRVAGFIGGLGVTVNAAVIQIKRVPHFEYVMGGRGGGGGEEDGGYEGEEYEVAKGQVKNNLRQSLEEEDYKWRDREGDTGSSQEKWSVTYGGKRSGGGRRASGTPRLFYRSKWAAGTGNQEKKEGGGLRKPQRSMEIDRRCDLLQIRFGVLFFSDQKTSSPPHYSILSASPVYSGVAIICGLSPFTSHLSPCGSLLSTLYALRSTSFVSLSLYTIVSPTMPFKPPPSTLQPPWSSQAYFKTSSRGRSAT